MIQKRALKKIRRPHVNHQDHQTEPEYDIENLPERDNVHIINKCIGIVGINGGIHVSMSYLNPVLKINEYHIDHTSHIRTVSIHLNIHSGPEVSYENTIQRLEAYGNPEQKAWAESIRGYVQNRPKMIEDFLRSANSQDHVLVANFKRAKARAISACKEIETKYSFAKIVTFSSRESMDVLLLSYSEGFLQKLDYNTLEEFVEWTKDNGLPQVFNGDCPEHLQLAKDFFDFTIFEQNNNIAIGPEYSPTIFNKNDEIKNLKAQFIYVLEPSTEGFFISGYFILKDESSIIELGESSSNRNQMIIEEISSHPQKV